MAQSPTYSVRWQKYLKEQENEITTLKEQLKGKEKQLKRHGGHTKDCACREPYITKTGAIRKVPRFDCGWAALEKEQQC